MAKGGVHMTDKNPKRFANQRNAEPKTIDTTLTGNHPTGNYITEEQGIRLPEADAAAEIWIEQDDQAKQGMARGFRVDPKQAQAAPSHPHIGHVRGSGEIQ
jgi:hypothetical protein